ncbi:MAG TPA: hypothetical protein P5119_05735 [Candidatus Aminicenantes bacterium]|nr:hypothetical protein [Candidatus Aminicenantes bacterium]HRY64824.1 hypothetical protein [Candidatus Aminicenantes bacterium]HRZ71737.1 hypothetical protein [Candidatus Aminicenantes bacterium]
MSDRYEPDPQFVDKLEWQLASEFRRGSRLKPAPGRIAVPRTVVGLSLAAGVLLLGVAATKAADLIKDSWRRKIEVARLETEVKIKRAFLAFTRDAAAKAEDRFSLGLVDEDECLASKRAADRTAIEVRRAGLDLEEAKVSGEAPRNELYAPVVGGRDYVSERLELEREARGFDRDLAQARENRLLRLFELGLVSREELGGSRTSLASEEAALQRIEKRLALRKAFLTGGLSAEELEIQERLAAAEINGRRAQSGVDFLRERLESLRVREAAGQVSGEDVRLARMDLEATQAQLDLALQEIEILKKIR